MFYTHFREGHEHKKLANLYIPSWNGIMPSLSLPHFPGEEGRKRGGCGGKGGPTGFSATLQTRKDGLWKVKICQKNSRSLHLTVLSCLIIL